MKHPSRVITRSNLNLSWRGSSQNVLPIWLQSDPLTIEDNLGFPPNLKCNNPGTCMRSLIYNCNKNPSIKPY